MAEVPRVVEPERKVTLPVGVIPVTVAVRVSCWLAPTLFAEAVSCVREGTGCAAEGAGLSWLSRDTALKFEYVRRSGALPFGRCTAWLLRRAKNDGDPTE